MIHHVKSYMPTADEKMIRMMLQCMLSMRQELDHMEKVLEYKLSTIKMSENDLEKEIERNPPLKEVVQEIQRVFDESHLTK